MQVLFGKSLFSILIYVIIELICMGSFYHVLKKYNYIISIIFYLAINFIISIFYSSISGSILFDIFFNFIIALVIILVYKKSVIMENRKWFIIIAMLIDCILSFLIAKIWRVVGINIYIAFFIYGILFSPFILCAIVSAIAVFIARKKLINKSKKNKIIVYTIIIIICGIVCVQGGYAFLNYISAKPDKVYVEMNKINEEKSLIGLSKEQVVELLGEPETKEDDDNVYVYDAGKITDYLFFGERNFYLLRIFFDENDKVKTTSISEVV